MEKESKESNNVPCEDYLTAMEHVLESYEEEFKEYLDSHNIEIGEATEETAMSFLEEWEKDLPYFEQNSLDYYKLSL